MSNYLRVNNKTEFYGIWIYKILSSKFYMQCVILAAGRGVRMGEMTERVPKPMLKIKEKPKLAYSVRGLPEVIDEVIFIVGHLGEQVRSFFGEKYDGRKIRYVAQEELDGTGGAIALVKNMVHGKFLVIMGDDLYLKNDLEKLTQKDLAILVYETDEAESYGLVDVDENENLLKVVEYPHGREKGLVATGAYVLDRTYFEYPMMLKAKGSTEYGLPQTLVQMRDKNEVQVVKAEKWFPIGSAEALEEAQERIEEFID